MLSMPATFHHSPATSNLFDNPGLSNPIINAISCINVLLIYNNIGY